MRAPVSVNDAEAGREAAGQHPARGQVMLGEIREALQPFLAPAAPFERSPQSRNIAVDVARTLRDEIVTLAIPPGAMLSEQDVARRLGVSRQPVREAFIKLADLQLVVIRPQRGTQVVRIARRDLANALFVRDAIECAVVREAARRIGPDDAEILADNLAQQRDALRDGRFGALFAIDEHFHQGLAHVAGRPDVWAIIDRVKPHLDRLHWLSRGAKPSLAPILAQHQDIFDAVRARDPALAAERMALHIRGFVSHFDTIAARYPDLFDDGDLARN